MVYQPTTLGESQPETAQDHGWGKQEATNSKDKRTPRNVEVVDVSDDDEEQDPPTKEAQGCTRVF